MDYPQKCALCDVRRTGTNTDELCSLWREYNDFDAPHEWITDYQSGSTGHTSYQPSTTKQAESGEKPARYDEAKTWLGLRTLIQPFSTLKISQRIATTPPALCCSNFSSCDHTPKACEILCDTHKDQLEAAWGKLRPKVLADLGFQEIYGKTTKKYLTHTGLLRAELFLQDGKGVSWTFYASAANVCIVDRQVVRLITGVTQSASGSCHSEQLCMYWLHDELETLSKSKALKSVHLRWYTELPMCDLWCVPTLRLFTAHWNKLGLIVISDAFQVGH